MRRGARGLAVLLSLTLLGVGWAGAALADVAPSSLTMSAVGTPGTIVTGPGQFSVGGDTPVRIAVSRISSGNPKVVAGPDAATRAIEFPSYVKSGTYPRAVVTATPTSGAALSPGASDFEYGAVFRLNATSSGRTIDNGDNLLQRGLYEEPSQFKLQLDHGYPSCLVRGSAGQVFASSPLKVTADKWYRATCSRVGSRVTVQVAPYGGTVAPVSAVANGTSGTLTFPATEPASIGGKVSPSGVVVSSATDQFNGAVANVWVSRIPPPPPPNQPPEARASATCTDLECSFNGADSTDADSDPLTYAWDFADGADPGAGVSPTHTYATGAERTVTLTVTDDHGNSDTDTVVATTTDPTGPPDPPPVDPEVDEPPVAHAAATCTDLDCSFSAAGSTDPENEPLTYAWDFGDGTDPGSGVTTSHNYATGAERTVTLTVTDDHGNSDTDEIATLTSDPVIDQPPVAHATATCAGLGCTFSAADSTDPENGPLSYAWDFGDGSAPGSGVSTSHTYATGAARTVTLTVTDDHSGSDTDTVLATTTTPPAATPISLVAAAATNGNRTSHTVTVPAGVRAGDALLLFFTANSTSPTYTNPAGWTLVQSRNGDGTVVRAYRKVATATDAGSSVKVTSSSYAKSDLSVVAYRNTNRTNPIAASASKVDNVTGAAHVSPALTATGSTSWLVTYWADKSASTTAWTAPAGQSVRARTFGTAAGHISALLTDSNGAVPAGATGQKTATANSSSSRGVSVSILLASTP